VSNINLRSLADSFFFFQFHFFTPS
jgi:hypothetical protein